MKTLHLTKVNHNWKMGDPCPMLTPNVTEDVLFKLEGNTVGFFIRDLRGVSPLAADLATLANHELRSERVPKTVMSRVNLKDRQRSVDQYSTIIGSCPPKPHMRRPYPMRSSVHSVKSAETFIKAMLKLVAEGERILKERAPDIYEAQAAIIEKVIPPKWRFGRLFTSSISNYNIAANFHRDNANLEHCVNIIITKRKNAMGGNLHVPDYGATFDSVDNSMLVYPAWMSLHGVTPICPLAPGGYRNSLVFYPLKAFKDYWD